MEFKMDLEDVTQTEYAEAEAWQTAVENMVGVVSLPWKYKATDVAQCAQAKVEAVRAFLGYMITDKMPDYLGTWLQKDAEPEKGAVRAGSDIESVPGELPPGTFVARPGEKVHIGDLAPGEIKEIELLTPTANLTLEGIDEADEPPKEGPALSPELAKLTLQGIDEAGEPVTEEIDIGEDGCFKPGTVVETVAEDEPDENSKEGGLRELPETE